MGRRWRPDLIPDIEMLDDTDGRIVIITLYPDGRWTIGELEYPADDQG